MSAMFAISKRSLEKLTTSCGARNSPIQARVTAGIPMVAFENEPVASLTYVTLTLTL
jgi:hypothetical protein